jgi:hypothetical protein
MLATARTSLQVGLKNRDVSGAAVYSTAPTPGTNTILITHKPNIIDALGEDWFDVEEGEASIFRPDNGSYRFIGRVQMEDWSVLGSTQE